MPDSYLADEPQYWLKRFLIDEADAQTLCVALGTECGGYTLTNWSLGVPRYALRVGSVPLLSTAGERAFPKPSCALAGLQHRLVHHSVTHRTAVAPWI